jgi:outer membrane protein
MMKHKLVNTFLCITVFFTVFVHAQEKILSLEECVEISLKQNADIVMGEFAVKQAGKDVIVAFSNFLPKVSTEMGYTHSVAGPRTTYRIDTRTGLLVPATSMEETSWSSSAGASVNETIFNGGYNFFNLKQSRALKSSMEYNFNDTKQQTIYVVKERYYNLLAAEKLLGVAEETLKSSEESFKRAEMLFEVGKVPKSDVLKAKVQLETDRLGVIEAQNALVVARASLNYVLGFDVNNTIKVVDNLDVPEIEINYEDVIENAFARHPAIKKQEFDLKASKAGIGMAISQYLPSLSVYYAYSWSHKNFNEISHIFDRDYSWYMGATLSLPIFQGFSRYAYCGKARLAYMSNQEALAQAKREVALEVQQAYFEVQQSKKKIAVTNDAVEAAEEDLRLNKEKYNLGAGTMLDLIDAQVSYTSARSDHIQALYNYKYAIARLEKSMGMLEK